MLLMLKGKEYESTGRTETLLLLNDSSWEWIVFISIVSPIYLPLWKERVPVSSCLHMTFFKVTLEILLEIQHLYCLAAFFFPSVNINFIWKQKLYSLLTLFCLEFYIGATFWHSSQVPTSCTLLMNPGDFYGFFSFSLMYCFLQRK